MCRHKKKNETKEENNPVRKWAEKTIEFLKSQIKNIKRDEIPLYLSLLIELYDFCEHPSPEKAAKIMAKFMILYERRTKK